MATNVVTGEAARNGKAEAGAREFGRAIKAPQTRSSFLKFLFYEYKKIRDFGSDRHIIYPKMLPPTLQLNADAPTFITKDLQPLSIDLYKVLTHVLKRRWSQLHKQEYNAIVLLKKLCEKIALTNFNLLNYSDRDLIDRLRPIEVYFLALHSDTRYPEMIMRSVSRVLERDAKHKERIPDIIITIKRILFSEIDTPSLRDFILALNMFKYRKHFRLKDLISSSCGEIISSDVFECGEDMQKEIDTFVQECRENLLFLSHKKREIEEKKMFMPRDENGEIDLAALRHLYESWKPEERHGFARDQEDMVQFTIRLFSAFEESFRNLLCGEVKLFGIGTKRIFPPDFFRRELQKLRAIIESLQGLSYDHTSEIPYKQYLSLKGGQNTVSQADSDVVAMIDDALDLLFGLGKRIEDLLRSSAPGGGSKNTRGSKSSSFAVPLKEKIILRGGRDGKKSVAEALSFTVSVCYLICFAYRDKNIYAVITNEKMVLREITAKMEMLARLADPEVYQETKENVDHDLPM
jgi:hypothetical protein